MNTFLSVAVSLALLGVPQTILNDQNQVQSHYGPLVFASTSAFKRCKAFKSSGKTYWKGQVRGKKENFASIGDNDQFVPFVKADCFDNESKCKQFVLEQSNQADRNGSVDYARCNRVG